MARGGRPDRQAAEPRLDPVRWRRPSRTAVLRLASVAALLMTAASLAWSGSPSCLPAAPSPAATPSAPGRSSPTPATTDSRPAMPPGSVGVPVRVAEPAALTMVRPGDRVDLLRIEEPGGTTTVAGSALVLEVTGADDPVTGGLLVALKPAEAERAAATPGRGYAVLLRPG